jgi:hypothetical protein
VHELAARLMNEITAARAAIAANYGRLWGEAERFSRAAGDAEGTDPSVAGSPPGVQDETTDPEGERRLAE